MRTAIYKLLNKVRNKLIRCSWKKSLKIKDTKYNLAQLLNATLPCLVFLSRCPWSSLAFYSWIFGQLHRIPPVYHSLHPTDFPFLLPTEQSRAHPSIRKSHPHFQGWFQPNDQYLQEKKYMLFSMFTLQFSNCSTSLKVRVLSSNCTYLC